MPVLFLNPERGIRRQDLLNEFTLGYIIYISWYYVKLKLNHQPQNQEGKDADNISEHKNGIGNT